MERGVGERERFGKVTDEWFFKWRLLKFRGGGEKRGGGRGREGKGGGGVIDL